MKDISEAIHDVLMKFDHDLYDGIKFSGKVHVWFYIMSRDETWMRMWMRIM